MLNTQSSFRAGRGENKRVTLGLGHGGVLQSVVQTTRNYGVYLRCSDFSRIFTRSVGCKHARAHYTNTSTSRPLQNSEVDESTADHLLPDLSLVYWENTRFKVEFRAPC